MIEQWHEVVASKDPKALKALLADDAVFHSPVVHTPQVGKPLVAAYLLGAFTILGSGGFRYRNQWVGEQSAALEFEAELDGLAINGVDLIHWNEQGLITEFKVMLRPLKAVNHVHQLMKNLLTESA